MDLDNDKVAFDRYSQLLLHACTSVLAAFKRESDISTFPTVSDLIDGLHSDRDSLYPGSKRAHDELFELIVFSRKYQQGTHPKRLIAALLDKMQQKATELMFIIGRQWVRRANQVCQELLVNASTSKAKKAKKRKTKQTKTEEQYDTKCIVCLDNPRDHVYMPCHHKVVCTDCYKALRARSSTCPWCRCELV